MTTFLFAALLLVLMAGGFFYLKIRVDRVVSGEEWIRKIRDEIDQLVLEMNQTAERNVALLENRVKALQELLKEADRKISLMEKESEKSDLSRQVYSHLKRSTVHPPVQEQEGINLSLFEEAGSSPEQPVQVKEDVTEVQKSLKDKVMELYGQGFSAEVISQKLGASISEVDLIINLNTGGVS